jgi:hypothetical protein|tara:strand:+ start:215 stop:403 length:189 start_codon:yes stop_codon:yes gene_type:complete
MKWQDILKSDFSKLDNIGLKNLYFNLKDTARTERDNKFLFEILQEMIRRGMVYDTKKKNKKE